jgi:hypothetical protein
MYQDNLGTLRSLKAYKEKIAERDEKAEVRIAKEILRQTRRGWSVEDIAAAVGRTTNAVQRILREAKAAYGDAYTSGVISADKKGQANPTARTTPKWLPGMEKKEKPKKIIKPAKKAAKPDDEASGEPAKKKTSKAAAVAPPIVKRKSSGSRKKKTVTPPVLATDETHYEDPTFKPDNFDFDAGSDTPEDEPEEISAEREEDASVA